MRFAFHCSGLLSSVCTTYFCGLALALVLLVSSLDVQGVVLKEYPNARQVYASKASAQEFQLALGKIARVGNTWAPERELRLKGQLQRTTLELPEGHSPVEAFDFFTQQLQELNARALFVCQSRECGRSNAWANEYFKVVQLYGSDRSQHYGAYEVGGNHSRHYFVVYAVERRNKRAYLQVDHLKVDTGNDQASAALIVADPSTVLQALRKNGYYQLSSFRVGGEGPNIAAEQLQVVVSVLNLDRRLNLLVVARDYGAGTLDQQLENSDRYAHFVVRRLIELGVEESRLEVHGIASLAPTSFNNTNPEVNLVLAPSVTDN